jgi:hypothetical protein
MLMMLARCSWIWVLMGKLFLVVEEEAKILDAEYFVILVPVTVRYSHDQKAKKKVRRIRGPTQQSTGVDSS